MHSALTSGVQSGTQACVPHSAACRVPLVRLLSRVVQRRTHACTLWHMRALTLHALTVWADCADCAS
jgi:hypothetical protein